MSVRPEFGPTLPQLIGRRWGVSERKALAGCVVAFLVLVGLVLVIRGGTGREEFVHRGRPAFTLSYPTSSMKPRPPEAGELGRFETRRGKLSITVTLRAADFPGRRFGELPIVASLHADAVAREVPGVEFREEGRTRLNRQPGYELLYRYGAPDARVFGRDVLVFADESGLRHGVLLSMRTTKPGVPMTAEDRDLVKAVRKASHSLRFESAHP